MCSPRVESGKTVFVLIILSGLLQCAFASRFDSLQLSSAEALNRGRLQDAKQFAFEAMELAEDSGDRVEIALANYRLANCFQASEYFESAAPLYEKAIQLADVSGDSALLTKVFTTYGVMQVKMGQFERGRQNIGSALKLANIMADSHALAVCELNLAQSHYWQDSLALAAQHFRQALLLAQRQSDLSLRAACHQNLGQAEADLGRYPQALENTNKALAISLQLNETYHVNKCYKNITHIHLAQGDVEAALQAQVDFYETLETNRLEVGPEMNAHQADIMRQSLESVRELRKHLSRHRRLIYGLLSFALIVVAGAAMSWYRGRRNLRHLRNELEGLRMKMESYGRKDVNGFEPPASLASRIQPLLEHQNPLLAPCYTMLAANVSITRISEALHRSRRRVHQYVKDIAVALNIPEDEVKKDALKHGRF